MKKSSIVLALSAMFLSNFSYAATFDSKPITYKYVTQYNEKRELKFPFVSSENSSVSKYINTFLHQALLGTLPPSEGADSKPIELRNFETSELELSSMKVTNGERVLSFSFMLEGCGAYCENYEDHFEFDTRNGRVLTVEELIKPNSLRKVANIVSQANEKTIKKFMKGLEKESVKPKSSKSKKEDLERIDDQISLYEYCLKRYDKDEEFAPYKDSPGTMTILEGGLNFSHGRCSNHAARALDDLWEVSHTLKGEELRPYLTEYGKYIMFGEGSGNVPAVNQYAQLYQGKLGDKIGIILYVGNLKRYENKKRSYSKFEQEKYFYTKYKKAISLSLSEEESKNDEYVLIENSLNDETKPEDRPRFKFRMVGNKLVGKWVSPTNTLPFEATPLN